LFRISSDEIPPLNTQMPHLGAVVTFDGIVRDLNDGRSVIALEYEAYVPLAEKEGNLIISEAKEKFGDVEVLCVHRVGKLTLGDVAIRAIAGAVHRAEAFKACQYVVDEVKARVPIWKRESYVEGDSGWINAQTSSKGDGQC
jgi:molybdopterin synthase catalytic subunit